MRILIVHNPYRQRGGEDVVFEAERDLLKAHGHAVRCIVQSNEALASWPPIRRIGRLLWNGAAYSRMLRELRAFKPDIVHVHNCFHALSPSIHHAVRREKVPLVQSLHNYRLFCLNGFFYRQNAICEKCRNRSPWPGVQHACYRDSRGASVVVAVSLLVHRLLKTWSRCVTRFIVFSRHGRDRMLSCGLDGSKIRIKPHFLSQDPGPGPAFRPPTAIFLGRFSVEKGLVTLLDAVSKVRHPDFLLKCCGDGPLQSLVENAVCNRILNLGFLPRDSATQTLQSGGFLVFPSELPETFGISIIEAFATGTPVIASRLGAQAELVEDGFAGLLFEPGNANDLAAKIEWACEHPDAMRRMGMNARETYLRHYSADVAYERLMKIYREARDRG